jgi:uncharacterized protein YejL (UPF0352 family)
MTETDPKFRKSRGKGFPVMPLDEAVAATKKAGSYGRDHSVDDYAGFLGHSTSNSGPFKRKMAALNDWGLINREGERVGLTDLAMRIAHPPSADDEHEAIRTAFLQEPMFAAVYEEASKGTDLSLAFLGGRAVNAFGVAPASKDNFAKSFARSVQAARLGTFEGDTIRLLTEGEPNAEEPLSEIQNGDERHEERPNPPSIGLRKSVARPTLSQEWEVNGGTLVFEAHLDHPLPAAAYAKVGGVAAAIEDLAAALGQGQAASDAEWEGNPVASES